MGRVAQIALLSLSTLTYLKRLSDRTQQVQDAIVAAVQGLIQQQMLTATHLAAITSLIYTEKASHH